MPFLIAPLSGRVNVQSGKTSDDQHNTPEQEPSSVEEIKLGAELLSNNQKRKVPSSSNVENVKKAKSDQASEADPDSGIFLELNYFIVINY